MNFQLQREEKSCFCCVQGYRRAERQSRSTQGGSCGHRQNAATSNSLHGPGGGSGTKSLTEELGGKYTQEEGKEVPPEQRRPAACAEKVRGGLTLLTQS